MEEMNPLIQAFGEMLEQKLVVVLDQELDKKLEEKLEEVLDRKMEEILERLAVVEETVLQMNVTIENELRPNIQILAENYVPAAQNYEKKSEKIIQMDTDIKILKSVVAGHGKKISRLAGES